MITFFGIIIIATILFIGYTLKWFFGLYDPTPLPFMPISRMIEVRAYRAVDYQDSFIYTPVDEVIKRNQPFDYFTTERIVNPLQRDRIIEDFCRKLCIQMIRDGIVEIEDREDWDHPYRRRVSFNIKVYKRDDR